MTHVVIKARSDAELNDARGLVWEFFDFLRVRYPEMHETIDAYIAEQDVAEELAHFADYFLPPHGECFLAISDGQPVGLVMLKPHGASDGEMNRMFVRGTARGMGLGRALGDAVVREARARGYGALWLDALYRHVEALPLYESLGFRTYADPQAFGGDDERVIHMKMGLGGSADAQ